MTTWQRLRGPWGAVFSLCVACATPKPAPVPPVQLQTPDDGAKGSAGAAEAPSRPAQPAPSSLTASPSPAPGTSIQPPPAPRTSPLLTPVRPVLNAEVLRLRAAAQRRVLGDVALIEDAYGQPVTLSPIPVDGSGRPLWINGNALGRFVGVENEPALAHFHQRVEELATGRDRDGKLRILIYGASHTQGDLYTGYLRNYLQSRFGNGGAGFVQLGKLNQFYRTLDFEVESKGFRIEHVQKKDLPPGGRLGLMGAAAVGRYASAYARIEPRSRTDLSIAAQRYTLFYGAEPGGGDLVLSVDEERAAVLPGRAAEPEARYHEFERGLGWHDVQVKPAGNGPVRVYGLSVERATPGIVIDALGINGTRAANLLKWDEAIWHEHLRARAPELFVLAYGTNEVTDENEPIEVYRQNLREVLTRLRRALPDVSCLLVGPGDFPRQQGDVWVTRPRVYSIIAAQRELAPEFGCGFWDTFEFMGGSGSMHVWATAKPSLGSPDHVHFTARGYVKMGMALGDALMRAYDATHLLEDVPVALNQSR